MGGAIKGLKQLVDAICDALTFIWIGHDKDLYQVVVSVLVECPQGEIGAAFSGGDPSAQLEIDLTHRAVDGALLKPKSFLCCVWIFCWDG